jgi:hypothetical protein
LLHIAFIAHYDATDSCTSMGQQSEQRINVKDSVLPIEPDDDPAAFLKGVRVQLELIRGDWRLTLVKHAHRLPSSRKIFPQPAPRDSATWASTLWPSVDTRA